MADNTYDVVTVIPLDQNIDGTHPYSELSAAALDNTEGGVAYQTTTFDPMSKSSGVGNDSPYASICGPYNAYAAGANESDVQVIDYRGGHKEDGDSDYACIPDDSLPPLPSNSGSNRASIADGLSSEANGTQNLTFQSGSAQTGIVATKHSESVVTVVDLLGASENTTEKPNQQASYIEVTPNWTLSSNANTSQNAKIPNSASNTDRGSSSCAGINLQNEYSDVLWAKENTSPGVRSGTANSSRIDNGLSVNSDASVPATACGGTENTDSGMSAGVANNHESVAESSPGDGRIYDDISTSILAGVYDEDPGAMYDTIEDESSTTHGLSASSGIYASASASTFHKAPGNNLYAEAKAVIGDTYNRPQSPSPNSAYDHMQHNPTNNTTTRKQPHTGEQTGETQLAATNPFFPASQTSLSTAPQGKIPPPTAPKGKIPPPTAPKGKIPPPTAPKGRVPPPTAPKGKAPSPDATKVITSPMAALGEPDNASKCSGGGATDTVSSSCSTSTTSGASVQQSSDGCTPNTVPDASGDDTATVDTSPACGDDSATVDTPPISGDDAAENSCASSAGDVPPAPTIPANATDVGASQGDAGVEVACDSGDGGEEEEDEDGETFADLLAHNGDGHYDAVGIEQLAVAQEDAYKCGVVMRSEELCDGDDSEYVSTFDIRLHLTGKLGLNVDKADDGFIVTKVLPGKIAAESGVILPGMSILAVDDEWIRSWTKEEVIAKFKDLRDVAKLQNGNIILKFSAKNFESLYESPVASPVESNSTRSSASASTEVPERTSSVEPDPPSRNNTDSGVQHRTRPPRHAPAQQRRSTAETPSYVKITSLQDAAGRPLTYQDPAGGKRPPASTSTPSDAIVLTPQVIMQFTEKERIQLLKLVRSGDMSQAEAIAQLQRRKHKRDENTATVPKFDGLTPELLNTFTPTERAQLMQIVKEGIMTIDQAVEEIRRAKKHQRRSSWWGGRRNKHAQAKQDPSAALLPPVERRKLRRALDVASIVPHEGWLDYTQGPGCKRSNPSVWVVVNPATASMEAMQDYDGPEHTEMVLSLPLADICTVDTSDNSIAITAFTGESYAFAADAKESAREWRRVLLAPRHKGVVKFSEDLAGTPWYFPTLSRVQAEELLNTRFENGSFLIRGSKKASNRFVLSLISNGAILHSLISKTDHGDVIGIRYRMVTSKASCKARVEFQSLHELVLNYQLSPLPCGTRLRESMNYRRPMNSAKAPHTPKSVV